MSRRLALFAAILFIPAVASADTVWTYTGNVLSDPETGIGPNPCLCALDGSVTLDAAGTPVAWSFTDGTHTLTNLNSNGLIKDSGPSASPFSTWDIFLNANDGSVVMASNFGGDTFFAHDTVSTSTGNSTTGGIFLQEQENPGTWSTPEPGSLGLLAIGLALGLTMFRKKARAPVFSWLSFIRQSF